MYTHLTYTDRLRIEKALKNRLRICDIARLLNKHRNTISRELKRGSYTRLNGDTWEYYQSYSADIANNQYREHLKQKGPKLKIGSRIVLADFLENLMIGKVGQRGKRCSPGAAIALAKKAGMDVPFSRVTLYSYISKGVFLHLTNKHLIEKGKRKQQYNRVAKRAPAGESIERRPERINRNEEFGHWEMDSVMGKQKKGKCLVTLTERKSNAELAFLVPDHTAGSVVNVLDTIEEKLGSETFRRLFQSITVDNGTEFSSCTEMERSCISGSKRTKIYYCHPYSSWERGKNERQNRMLRRFFPKGIDLNGITQEEVDDAVSWINSLPRASLGWKCSWDLFRVEIPV